MLKALTGIKTSKAENPVQPSLHIMNCPNIFAEYEKLRAVIIFTKTVNNNTIQPFHAKNVQNSSLNPAYIDFGAEFCLHFQSGIAVTRQLQSSRNSVK